MRLTRRHLVSAASAAAAAARWGTADAQARYPTRPARFICPFAPGSSTDILSRQVCGKASEVLGQTIVVENRAGGSGITGSSFVARSEPDGYTLGLGVNMSHAAGLYLVRSLPYDPLRDFTPVALLAIQPSALIVRSDLRVNSVAELIALCRANPGKYAFGHTGRGVSSHLAGETFKKVAGLDVASVPYPGGQAVIDLLAGHIQFMFYPTTPFRSALETGELKLLATTSATRLQLFYPDLPTMIEEGFSDFTFPSWLAAFAPAKTPPQAVDALSAAFKGALADTTLAELMIATGSLPDFRAPADLLEMQKGEIARYKQVVGLLGLEPE